MADKIKLVFAFLLLVAGVVGFYYLRESPTVLKIASVLAGMILAALMAWTSDPGKQFYAYAQESVTETKKVVWPSRKETIQTTGMVVAFVLVMAVFLWMVDGVLVWLVQKLLGTEG